MKFLFHGYVQIQLLAIVGGRLQMVLGFTPFQYGSTVTIHQAIYQRSGTNTIPFSLPQQVFHGPMFISNIISISYAPQTLHRLSKCLMVLLISSSNFSVIDIIFIFLTIVLCYRNAWNTGIWAWDHIHQDRVLLVLWVAALLGDNPMQSELSCHIGSMGKYFCRICHVKGSNDYQHENDRVHDHAGGTDDSGNGGNGAEFASYGVQQSDIEEVLSDGNGAQTSAKKAPQKKRQKKGTETMTEMVDRLRRFAKVCLTLT
jgi:hypothetical protein